MLWLQEPYTLCLFENLASLLGFLNPRGSQFQLKNTTFYRPINRSTKENVARGCQRFLLVAAPRFSLGEPTLPCGSERLSPDPRQVQVCAQYQPVSTSQLPPTMMGGAGGPSHAVIQILPGAGMGSRDSSATLQPPDEILPENEGARERPSQGPDRQHRDVLGASRLSPPGTRAYLASFLGTETGKLLFFA